MNNIYLPHIATIKKVEPQTPDTALISIVMDDLDIANQFNYLPGQFALLSVFGVGECPISFTSSPTYIGAPLQFCIRGIGKVTKAIVSLYEGEKIGIRGPFGNGFPIEQIEGKNLLFVAGGIGLIPLRSLINYVLDNRNDYNEIEIIYGAKSPADLCFKEELKNWNKDANVYLTVDKGDKNWKEYVGFVPQILENINPTHKDKVAFICGPPIMIKIVIDTLRKMEYPDNHIITTLEMKMKCGVGKCGRCNIENKYICIDGPVFTVEELKRLLWTG